MFPTGTLGLIWNSSLFSAVSVLDVTMCSAQMCWEVVFQKGLHIISGVTTGLSGIVWLRSQLVDVGGKVCYVLLPLSAPVELPGCWSFTVWKKGQMSSSCPKELSVSTGLQPLFTGFFWVCCGHPCEMDEAVVSFPLPSPLLLPASGLKMRPMNKSQEDTQHSWPSTLSSAGVGSGDAARWGALTQSSAMDHSKVHSAKT